MLRLRAIDMPLLMMPDDVSGGGRHYATRYGKRWRRRFDWPASMFCFLYLYILLPGDARKDSFAISLASLGAKRRRLGAEGRDIGPSRATGRDGHLISASRARRVGGCFRRQHVALAAYVMTKFLGTRSGRRDS